MRSEFLIITRTMRWRRATAWPEYRNNRELNSWDFYVGTISVYLSDRVIVLGDFLVWSCVASGVLPVWLTLSMGLWSARSGHSIRSQDWPLWAGLAPLVQPVTSQPPSNHWHHLPTVLRSPCSLYCHPVLTACRTYNTG